MTKDTEIEGRSIESKDTKDFFKSIQHVGLDVDDTMVHHDPRDLFFKFTEAVLFDRDRQSVKPGTYIHVLDDSQKARAYIQNLAPRISSVFNLSAKDFYKAVALWVNGTLQLEQRKRIVEEELHFSSEEAFWEAYTRFGSLVPRKPEEYLVFTPGAESFLTFISQLRNEGKLSGIHIISNMKRSRLENYIQFVQQKGFVFDSVTSARDDIGEPKPSPKALLAVSNRSRLEVDPSKSIYVGNGEEDIKSAVRAGWTPVIVNKNSNDLSNSSKQYFRFRSIGHFLNHWIEKIK